MCFEFIAGIFSYFFSYIWIFYQVINFINQFILTFFMRIHLYIRPVSQGYGL